MVQVFATRVFTEFVSVMIIDDDVKTECNVPKVLELNHDLITTWIHSMQQKVLKVKSQKKGIKTTMYFEKPLSFWYDSLKIENV